jgi:hypothetical protein
LLHACRCMSVISAAWWQLCTIPVFQLIGWWLLYGMV